MAAFPALFCLLLATIATGQYVQVVPEEAIVRRGQNVSMVCKVPGAIKSCSIQIGQDFHNLELGSSDQTGNVQYNGKGFQEGECGVSVKSVDASMHGNISCFIPRPGDTRVVRGVMQLIIAEPPAAPQLEVSRGSGGGYSYKEGDELRARCVVANGRPVAAIKWFLGDRELLEGLHNSVVVPLQSNPNAPSFSQGLVTISQNLTRRINADDSNKLLICRTEHQALDGPRDASQRLIVEFQPKPVEPGPITIFGLKLGEPAALNVTFQSNPPVSVAVWRFRLQTEGKDVELGDGTQVYDKFEVAAPVEVGNNGFYNVTLYINELTKEDVERPYNLFLRNGVGYEDVVVRISTMDEPAGVDLDAGAIVGIVIAIIALLAVIFIVVFAKATHRWCFKDNQGGELQPKSSGESSDTESAVGGPREKRKRRLELSKALPALRSVLPARFRDKVTTEHSAVQQAETEPEDKPLQEGEKKNIVYAELALSQQGQDKTPNPETTEYAEIVYTNQAEEAKKEEK